MREQNTEAMITMSKASEIVAIALAQIGYKEKASNKNLDDPAANAGSPILLRYFSLLFHFWAQSTIFCRSSVSK